MSYEALLDLAYKDVKVSSETSRFEVMKVKGHHEGTRTIISNFLQIASLIRRDPENLMKFLNKQLASPAEISGDRLIFSRKLSSKDINAKIERYVEAFVLCSKCKKPDTELVSDGGRFFVKCLACGEKREVHKI